MVSIRTLSHWDGSGKAPLVLAPLLTHFWRWCSVASELLATDFNGRGGVFYASHKMLLAELFLFCKCTVCVKVFSPSHWGELGGSLDALYR